MKSQHGGFDSVRHERPIARPRKPKNEDGEDDEPTYVDGESNDTITKAQYADMLKSTDPAAQDDRNKPLDITENDDDLEQTSPKEMPKEEAVATVGVSRKKRQVKAVTVDDSGSGEGEKTTGGSTKRQMGKPARKAKKIKLSFDEDAQT